LAKETPLKLQKMSNLAFCSCSWMIIDFGYITRGKKKKKKKKKKKTLLQGDDFLQ
jgi:hypothetical protein